MLVLGIESSCDETACAIVEDGKKIISNVVATQIPFHQIYKGVVPEIASRKHAEWILPVVRQALNEASMKLEDVDAIAATNRPGLMGSLLVGLTFAKTLAWSVNKPFYAVNHMLGHMYAAHLENDIQYPYLGLLVSGGHSIIAKVNGFDDLEILGTTIDDSVGEAFDKVSKYYDLGYPGGVIIDKLAKNGDPKAFTFPVPKMDKGDHRYDVSFSGLKSAVLNYLNGLNMKGEEYVQADVAASFQACVVDMLVSRARLAIREYGFKDFAIAGGVASNTAFRDAMMQMCEDEGVGFYMPSPILCTDNAAMIGAAAYYEFEKGNICDLDLNAVPGLKL